MGSKFAFQSGRLWFRWKKFFRKDHILNEKKKKIHTWWTTLGTTVISSEEHIACVYVMLSHSLWIWFIYIRTSTVSSSGTWIFADMNFLMFVAKIHWFFSSTQKKSCRIAFSQLNWMEFIGCQSGLNYSVRCSLRNLWLSDFSDLIEFCWFSIQWIAFLWTVELHQILIFYLETLIRWIHNEFGHWSFFAAYQVLWIWSN